MKKLSILLAIITIVASSCGTTYRCYPSKKSRDYAVIMEGGSIAEANVKTTLVSVKRTMLGYKHFFVTDSNDTIVRFFQCRFDVNRQYWVLKNI